MVGIQTSNRWAMLSRAIAEALQYDEELKQQLGIKRTEMQVSLCSK